MNGDYRNIGINPFDGTRMRRGNLSTLEWGELDDGVALRDLGDFLTADGLRDGHCFLSRLEFARQRNCECPG